MGGTQIHTALRTFRNHDITATGKAQANAVLRKIKLLGNELYTIAIYHLSVSLQIINSSHD